MNVALGNDCGRLLLDRVAPQRGSRDLWLETLGLGVGLL